MSEGQTHANNHLSNSKNSMIGNEVDALSSLNTAIAGVQLLSEAVSLIQRAAEKIDTAKTEVEEKQVLALEEILRKQTDAVEQLNKKQAEVVAAVELEKNKVIGFMQSEGPKLMQRLEDMVRKLLAQQDRKGY
jgi:hypothetical protein